MSKRVGHKKVKHLTLRKDIKYLDNYGAIGAL